ncbi:hypothetical protein Trco_004468 [Trichoderma cornu-damae]|uniref:Protein ZIP4 homolog n=1 Tax=Trichoderma cornu-damae TaxID=654480 RepID=A0A9P8QMK9_9HYPO|nr:hypothetical protein Trco_004468 [Trichoderma cornu-damae]
MAHEDLPSANGIRKARSLIGSYLVILAPEFAVTLQARLSDSPDARTVDLLCADTSHHIQLIHTAAQQGSKCPFPSELAKDVERQGRNLWNLCVRLRRERDESAPTEKAGLLVKARSFAFYMLELGRSTGRVNKGDESEILYFTNLALTLGKLCVGNSDLDAARLALQKAAELMERLKGVPPHSSDSGGQNRNDWSKLDAKYLAMRTALSWKEDRLDVAEHMFGKIDALRPTLDPHSAEIIADTLQHLGFDLISKGDHGMAVKWLKRAYDVINHQPLDQLTIGGLELRLAICQGLVRGLLDVGSQESIQEANDLVEYVESEIGDKPLVLHWRLEILQKAPGEVFDTDAYSSILHRMVRSFDYSYSSFEFLFYHIKNLNEKTPRLARGLLDELLLQHVVSSNNSEWIGKIVVRRIWMSTVDDTDSAESLPQLRNLLDKAYDGLSESLGSDIAGAAHSDHELGIESIKHLGRLSDTSQGRNILYACIREAQQAGDKLCTLTALQAIMGSWKVDEATPSNLTSILRCSIRLIHLIEEQDCTCADGSQIIAHAEDLCHTAAEHANKDPRDDEGNRVFTMPELHWFRKNAYNMGVAQCDTWELSHIVRIFKTCLAFSGCYPKDLPVSEISDMALMAMRCHFVIAAALVSLARAEDKMDEQLQHYLEARRHIGEFDAILETSTNEVLDESILKDLIAKLSTLFVFDFEAAVTLKNWDGLNEIVRKAKTCRDEVMYKAMGDCILRSRAPGKGQDSDIMGTTLTRFNAPVMFSTMRLITNEIFELEEFDYEKLAKYIRCMFQAILGVDDSSALQLVDQALQIAHEGKQVGAHLPSAELEWLVATSFNHAVDYYARGDEGPCHVWALKAMDLAEYVDDGGVLRDTLQAKFAKLQFDRGRMLLYNNVLWAVETIQYCLDTELQSLDSIFRY